MKTAYTFLFVAIGLSLVISCNAQNKQQEEQPIDKAPIDFSQLDTATFAGGCFWCVEASFEQIQGVVEAVSGYAGGKEKRPTYEQVSQGKTGHAEAVQVYYDPEVIEYGTLLDIFFTAHDPTQLNRQGPDIGKQYRSVVFYHNSVQERLIKTTMDELSSSGEFKKNIVTQVVPYVQFWEAEEYHQDYEKKHPDNPYVVSVSKPKIERVAQKFSHILKKE